MGSGSEPLSAPLSAAPLSVMALTVASASVPLSAPLSVVPVSVSAALMLTLAVPRSKSVARQSAKDQLSVLLAPE